MPARVLSGDAPVGDYCVCGQLAIWCGLVAQTAAGSGSCVAHSMAHSACD